MCAILQVTAILNSAIGPVHTVTLGLSVIEPSTAAYYATYIDFFSDDKTLSRS